MSSDRILFSPISIGKVSIKNRFAMAPMGPLGLGDAQGGFNQRGIDYYTARARGGTGLIITGVTFVDNTIEEHGKGQYPLDVPVMDADGVHCADVHIVFYLMPKP